MTDKDARQGPVNGDPVLIALTPEDCPVEWMRRGLPGDAIPVSDRLPAHRNKVLGWVSDPSVCIYFSSVVVWRTPGVGRDEWWAGLPGQYIDLARHKWRLSHWRPIMVTKAQA